MCGSFYVQYHVSPPWGRKHRSGEKFVFHDTTRSKMVDCQVFIRIGNWCCSIPACSPGALGARRDAQLRITSPCHFQDSRTVLPAPQCPSLPCQICLLSPRPLPQVGERRGWAMRAFTPRSFACQQDTVALSVAVKYSRLTRQ